MIFIVWGLSSYIRRVLMTSCYDLDGGRSERARVRAWVEPGGGGVLRNGRLCSPGAGADA